MFGDIILLGRRISLLILLVLVCHSNHSLAGSRTGGEEAERVPFSNLLTN